MGKKIYNQPNLQIVLIEDGDIVATSNMTDIGGDTDGWDARERRNAIWDD